MSFFFRSAESNARHNTHSLQDDDTVESTEINRSQIDLKIDDDFFAGRNDGRPHHSHMTRVGEDGEMNDDFYTGDDDASPGGTQVTTISGKPPMESLPRSQGSMFRHLKSLNLSDSDLDALDRFHELHGPVGSWNLGHAENDESRKTPINKTLLSASNSISRKAVPGMDIQVNGWGIEQQRSPSGTPPPATSPTVQTQDEIDLLLAGIRNNPEVMSRLMQSISTLPSNQLSQSPRTSPFNERLTASAPTMVLRPSPSVENVSTSMDARDLSPMRRSQFDFETRLYAAVSPKVVSLAPPGGADAVSSDDQVGQEPSRHHQGSFSRETFTTAIKKCDSDSAPPKESSSGSSVDMERSLAYRSVGGALGILSNIVPWMILALFGMIKSTYKIVQSVLRKTKAFSCIGGAAETIMTITTTSVLAVAFLGVFWYASKSAVEFACTNLASVFGGVCQRGSLIWRILLGEDVLRTANGAAVVVSEIASGESMPAPRGIVTKDVPDLSLDQVGNGYVGVEVNGMGQLNWHTQTNFQPFVSTSNLSTLDFQVAKTMVSGETTMSNFPAWNLALFGVGTALLVLCKAAKCLHRLKPAESSKMTEETFSTMNVKQLKAECKLRNMTPSAVKKDTVRRLCAHEDISSSFPARDLSNYNNLKLAELRAQLKDLNESTSGNREELMYRLLMARENRYSKLSQANLHRLLKTQIDNVEISKDDFARRLAEAGPKLPLQC